MTFEKILEKEDFTFQDIENLNWKSIPFMSTYYESDNSDFNTEAELVDFLIKKNSLNSSKKGIYVFSNIALGVFKVEVGNPILNCITKDYRKIEKLNHFSLFPKDLKYFKEERNTIMYFEIEDEFFNLNLSKIKKFVSILKRKQGISNYSNNSLNYNIEETIDKYQTNRNQEFLFFWDHTNNKKDKIDSSCLSQWWSSSFKIEGITYFSAEQFMMAEKARLFNDIKNLDNIINSKSARKAKQYGRTVIGFDEDIWIENRIAIVRKGNIEKFQQNQELKEFLLSTKDKILVEASPYDKIWGIGLDIDNVNSKNPVSWLGLNLLGFILMEVRDILDNNNHTR